MTYSMIQAEKHGGKQGLSCEKGVNLNVRQADRVSQKCQQRLVSCCWVS